jgi:crotonobetainyl-CoA:carnitine CoA-transferase CaiB-like acyl-CoA transferase
MSAVGEPGKEPLSPPGAQGQFVTGLFATIAALQFGKPGLTDVPMVQAVVATMIYDVVGYQYYGGVRARVGKRFGAAHSTLVSLRCTDGYAGLHAALHAQWLKLCDLVGKPRLKTDPRFATPQARAQHQPALEDELDAWFRSRTRWEAFHDLQRATIPASATPTMGEVLGSPQLRARDFFREVTTPGGKTLRVPGAPARVVAVADGEPNERTENGPWKPGALRILDLSMGWAGPLVSQVLACFGADVIKVESHTRFDWWRGSRPPGDDPALALHERSHVFNTANRGKRGITLNFNTERGRELACGLFASADIVVENFGAGVMEKLGFGWERLSELNPGLILLRQPGFGSTGPEGGYRVFGNTIEGMSGLTALMGYSNETAPIMMSNACGDPVSGLHGVIASLAAVNARATDGRGRYIEAAQLEGFLAMTSEALIDYQRTGKQPPRQGNHRPGHEPSGAFPAAGEDRWLVIDIRDDAEWQRLAEVIGQAWAKDAKFATVAGRASHHAELHDALGQWTSRRDRAETVEALVAGGVCAAALNNEPELLASGLFEGFFAGQERAPVGYHLYPVLPLVRGGEHIVPASPAPHLGEHNAEVLAGLGVDDAGLVELELTNVIGTVPV